MCLFIGGGKDRGIRRKKGMFRLLERDKIKVTLNIPRPIVGISAPVLSLTEGFKGILAVIFGEVRVR